MTAELWGNPAGPYDQPGGHTLIGDYANALSRRADTGTVDRLYRSGMLAERVPPNTLSSDTPGLLGGRLGLSVPQWVRQTVNSRQRINLALIDELVTADLPLGELPWVPTPTPPAPAPVVHAGAQKTEYAGRVLSQTGGQITPVTIAKAFDVSHQVLTALGDSVWVLAMEDGVTGLAKYLVDQLAATAGTPSTDLAAAFGKIEAARWTPDLLVTSRQGWAAAVAAAGDADVFDGMDRVIGAPTGGTKMYIVARAGTWIQASESEMLTMTEPSIGGYEASVLRWATYSAHAGAVAVIGA